MAPLLLAVAFVLAVQGGGADLPTLVLPPGDGGWVVRIVTTGGFTGRGSGHLTASSAGEMRCVAVAACPDRLVSDAQQWLSRLVTAVPLPGTFTPRPSPLSPGTCSDCVTTTMTVHRRDADGEQTVTYSWDVTTSNAVPEEALRLHAALIAIASPRGR